MKLELSNIAPRAPLPRLPPRRRAGHGANRGRRLLGRLRAFLCSPKRWSKPQRVALGGWGGLGPGGGCRKTMVLDSGQILAPQRPSTKSDFVLRRHLLSNLPALFRFLRSSRPRARSVLASSSLLVCVCAVPAFSSR